MTTDANLPIPPAPASGSSSAEVRPGVEVSCQSDLGCQRENNEDAVLYWEADEDQEFVRKGRLVIVADGMGGYEGGQEASRLAVETVRGLYRDFGGDDPQTGLVTALEAAHEQIRQCAEANPHLHGMGTTCTAAAIVRGALYYAHVGDSRLYLVRRGEIAQLTHDHSYVGRLVEAGMITREEAENHPQRNVLTAALGTGTELVMDSPAQPEPLQSGDALLLCTDGLWGQVRDLEILEAVVGRKAAEAGRRLIELARQRGGPDNITLAILRLA